MWPAAWVSLRLLYMVLLLLLLLLPMTMIHELSQGCLPACCPPTPLPHHPFASDAAAAGLNMQHPKDSSLSICSGKIFRQIQAAGPLCRQPT